MLGSIVQTKRDRLLNAVIRIEETDAHGILNILTFHRPLAETTRAPSPSSRTAEEARKETRTTSAHAHLFEDGGKVRAPEYILGRILLVETRIADSIVLTFFIFVGEDRVGLVDLLELLFRSFIPRIPVRVKLHRQFAIGFLDLGFVRRFGNAQ